MFISTLLVGFRCDVEVAAFGAATSTSQRL